MKFLACPGCAAKDETIARLDKRVDELERTFLAMMDPKAYALRYPKRPGALHPAQETQPVDPRAFGLVTPSNLRAQQPYESPLSTEQLEREFEAI
jgi:hypothetical protein